MKKTKLKTILYFIIMALFSSIDIIFTTEELEQNEKNILLIANFFAIIIITILKLFIDCLIIRFANFLTKQNLTYKQIKEIVYSSLKIPTIILFVCAFIQLLFVKNNLFWYQSLSIIIANISLYAIINYQLIKSYEVKKTSIVFIIYAIIYVAFSLFMAF